MEYDFRAIEAKWQKEWRERGTYKVEVDPSRPKFYVLDMFPYPSDRPPLCRYPIRRARVCT